MQNREIRELARVKDVRLWQIAEEVGCTASTFSVWLRQELTGDRRERVLKAIEDVAAARGGAG